MDGRPAARTTEHTHGQYQFRPQGDPQDRAPHRDQQSTALALRSFVRKVEEAIATGDRNLALAALKEAEPVIMRSAQKGVVHANAASRKVSRLNHRVAKLAQGGA